MKKHLLSPLQEILSGLVQPVIEKKMPWLSRIWLSILYVFGIVFWGQFYNWGVFSIEYHDWAEVWAPRLQVFRDALIKGVFPLHLSDLAAMRGSVDRIFAVADMTTTPQMILLRFMDVQHYVFINTLLLFTIAALSLLWIRRRFSLSLASFTYIFLLINFNGYLIAHFSVGHTNWSGYLLFPTLAILIFQLLDGDRSWTWVTKMSLLLCFIFLQGSFHAFTWCLWFLAFLAIISWKNILPLFKSVSGATLLCAFRILPPLLQIETLQKLSHNGGYQLIRYILQSMVIEVAPQNAMPFQNYYSNLGYWEFDIYIGIAGFIFLLLFGGIYLVISHVRQRKFPVLVVPILILLMLSVRENYYFLVLHQPALMAAERVTSRMIGLPLVMGLILAGIEFQKFINTRRLPLLVQLATFLPAMYIGYDLFRHGMLWNVTNAYQAFGQMARDLTLIKVSNHPDPQYFTYLGIGFAVAFVTFGILIFLSIREKKIKGTR